MWKDTLLPGISRKTDDLLRPQSKVHQVYTVDQKIQKRNGFTTSYVATINIRYQCPHPHQHHHPSSMISMTRNVPPGNFHCSGVHGCCVPRSFIHCTATLAVEQSDLGFRRQTICLPFHRPLLGSRHWFLNHECQ